VQPPATAAQSLLSAIIRRQHDGTGTDTGEVLEQWRGTTMAVGFIDVRMSIRTATTTAHHREQ
jgi:hypothetical protein